MRIFIEDSIHCERIGECKSFGEAIARLEQLAKLPWDQEPNRAPCTEWRNCGREYEVREYDDSATPWRLVRRADALKVSASSIEWVPRFESIWAERRGE